MTRLIRTATKHRANVARQKGIALLTVLILLLILAGASVALIQSQRGAVRQTADRLDVLEQNAASITAHDSCVATARAGIEAIGASAPLAGYSGRAAFASANDARWGHIDNHCLLEWYERPQNSAESWTPYIRVTSRVAVKGQMILEVSEWRYPACLGAQVCRGRAVNLLNDDGTLKGQLNTQYGAGSVQTARQRL